MSYQLEEILPEDQEIIIANFSADDRSLRALEYVKGRGRFPTSWAMDKGRDSYLLKEPMIVRQDSAEVPYLFFYAGRGYKILLEHMLGCNFKFAESCRPEDDSLSEVVEGIRQAFAIYGRWGGGEFNEFGEPEFKVSPVFKEEK